jgi:hypothetical protein
VTQDPAAPVARVLKFADRESDVILYEPGAATRARRILGLARSVSTWGDLRRLRSSEPADLVDPIRDYLEEEWAFGAGASKFGIDERTRTYLNQGASTRFRRRFPMTANSRSQ